MRGYQLVLSPMLGPRCRFYPSCSSYAVQALSTHGALKGSWLAGAPAAPLPPVEPGRRRPRSAEADCFGSRDGPWRPDAPSGRDRHTCRTSASFFGAILHPLEWVVADIMVGFHSVLSRLGMPAASGWTWALSIVGLVIVIRIILIPLFVKQIKASRGLQLIQPEMQKIQKKYKGKTDPASRQAMTQETMALYKESGTNPFASCLPILLQSPVFFALYRVLRNMASAQPARHRPTSPSP